MGAFTKLERPFLLLVLTLTALAGAADYGAWSSIPRFLLATAALAGLAWLVSLATDQLGRHFGPSVAGMLQATLGNLPELFVVIFALEKHELLLAQTAIVGSLLANALLVLGLVIVVGANRAKDGAMSFSARLPQDTTTLLLATVFIIVLLGLSLGSHDPASHHVKAISTIGAISLLFVYIAWIVPYLRSHSGPGSSEVSGPSAETVRLSRTAALLLLLLAGGASAFVSDWFVSGLTPAVGLLHISKAFAGLVIVAIAGNAVENASGIVLAAKGRSDLAISVVKSSVSQIAAFLFPLLVLISLALPSTLTFALAPVYVGALALMAIAVWQVTGDGRAAAFEGWALIALYVILAALALYE